MDCKIYKNHQLGRISDESFSRHLLNCGICRESKRLDDQLIERAGRLKIDVGAPHLWEKIRADLENEADREQRDFSWKVLFLSRRSLKIAASLSLLMILTVYFIVFNPGESASLLNDKALSRVQKIEKEYIDAISDLESKVNSEIPDTSLELSLRYRDRLQIIDEQILLCQKELRSNPMNVHIRNYLLAALKDKKDTLLAMNHLKK